MDESHQLAKTVAYGKIAAFTWLTSSVCVCSRPELCRRDDDRRRRKLAKAGCRLGHAQCWFDELTAARFRLAAVASISRSTSASATLWGLGRSERMCVKMCRLVVRPRC